MKKLIKLIVCLAMLVPLTGCSSVKNPAEQEYIVGQGNIKGNVDASDYYNRDERFEIGATKDGNPVFKNPGKAYDALIEKYSDGVTLIQNEFDLKPLTKHNYKIYKQYGWQVSTGSDDKQEMARFVSRFFDIYENSF